LCDVEKINGLNVIVQKNMTEKQIKCLSDIFGMCTQNKTLREDIKKNFVNMLLSNKETKIIMEWWDSLNMSFDLTSIGKVIAHANAKRIDNMLPDLD
jgi:hypothetical protein